MASVKRRWAKNLATFLSLFVSRRWIVSYWEINTWKSSSFIICQSSPSFIILGSLRFFLLLYTFPPPFSYFFPSRFTISLPLSLILDLKENFSRHRRTAVLSFCFQRSKKQNIPNQGKENFEIYKFGNVIISILSIYSQAKKTANPCNKQPTMCFFVG